jgi:hypothetical protein
MPATDTVPGCADHTGQAARTTIRPPRGAPAADGIPGGTTLTGGTSPTTDTLDPDQAHVILAVHVADDDGLCAGCAYLAHFCWAPCPRARQAIAVLGTAPVTQPGVR